MTMQRVFFIGVIIFAYLLWQKMDEKGIVHPPGVLVSAEPIQRATEVRPFAKASFILAPQAEFEIEARVLSRKNYRMDGGAKLAPVDFALGWGPMSDQAVLDEVEVSQSGRWFFLRWNKTPPMDQGVLMRHSGNMHIIPADERIEDVLKDVKTGNVVRLSGYLVNASDDTGFTWNSSLTRDDVGDGSCELFYVERAYIAL